MKQGVKIHQQLMQTFNLRNQIEGIIILNASYLTEGLFTTKCLCTIFTCSYILKYRSWDTPIRIFFKHSAWNMNAWKNLTHFFNFNGFGVTVVKSKKFHAIVVKKLVAISMCSTKVGFGAEFSTPIRIFFKLGISLTGTWTENDSQFNTSLKGSTWCWDIKPGTHSAYVTSTILGLATSWPPGQMQNLLFFNVSLYDNSLVMFRKLVHLDLSPSNAEEAPA